MRSCFQKLCCLFAAFSVIAVVCGCSGNATQNSNAENLIRLEGDSVSFSGAGIAVSGNTIRITQAGEYVVTGSLNNGRIQIETAKGEPDVTLILKDAHITCLSDSAIHVVQANKLKLVLAEGTNNSIISGKAELLENHDPNAEGAAVYSEDDLDLEGSGSVRILGYINNGITCKDDLTVQGGNVTVVAANNGLRASESIQFEDGNVTVTAQNDGIKTTSSKKDGKGYISFLGGTATVSARGDAVSAETQFRMMGGTLTLTTEGDPEQNSCKGIKANSEVVISGGNIFANTADHCIKSDGALAVQGGVLELASADGKGLSAEAQILVENGTVAIRAVDDGIDTPNAVAVTGGELKIIAGEDGIKAGKSGDSNSENGHITISGGTLYISAYQDGIDAKTKLSVTGGTIFALSNASKNLSLGDTTAQPVLFGKLKGLAGQTVTLTDGAGKTVFSMEAAYSFCAVQVTAKNLLPNTAYTVATERESIQVGG